MFYNLIYIFTSQKNFHTNSFLISIIFFYPIIFGLFDDKYNFKIITKLIFQILFSLLVLFFFDFEIFNSFFSIKWNLLLLILNFIFIIGFINFINFIDGSDGNLISFTAFVFLALIVKVFYLYQIDNYFYLIYFIIFLNIFYIYNINKKIFLGESGSFFISCFLLLNLNYFLKKNIIFFEDILILFSYFIVDMSLTFFLRLQKYGFSSFKAHKDHAYQFFCYKKKSHLKFNIILNLYNLFFIIPLYIVYIMNIIPSYIILLIVFIPSIIFAKYYSPLINEC